MQETIFFLFGSTGDLARLKILPALHDMWQRKELPENFRLIAIGRRKFTTVEYINYLAHAEEHPFTADLAPLNLEYLALDFDSEGGFEPFWERWQQHSRGKKLLYMSVSPDVLGRCLDYFESGKYSQQFTTTETAILIEKPFGENEASARKLNSRLEKIFSDDQIFRHDHYLTKDSVEALAEIRQKDSDIAKLLNHEFISEVKLSISESVDIGTRAGYFDGRGIIVDWVQSHMLQILSTACARPDFEHLDKAKVEFISSLELIPNSIVRGQYSGYQQVKGVEPNSQTETFIALELISSLPRWQDTVFSLAVGKALSEKKISLEFVFREPNPKFGNSLVLQLDPPGGHPLLKPLSGDEFRQTVMEVLADNHRHFVTMAEIVAQWKLVDKIRQSLGSSDLKTYTPGTSLAQLLTT